MLSGFCTLLIFDLLGELLAHQLHLPFPGALVGLLLLLAWLALRGGPGADLQGSSDRLLGCLALFYVPAAAGLITRFDVLAHDGWRIALAIVVASGLGLATTAYLMERLAPVAAE
jgi:holin-like protein